MTGDWLDHVLQRVVSDLDHDLDDEDASFPFRALAWVRSITDPILDAVDMLLLLMALGACAWRAMVLLSGVWTLATFGVAVGCAVYLALLERKYQVRVQLRRRLGKECASQRSSGAVTDVVPRQGTAGPNDEEAPR